jgi:hypothetical protein
MSSMASFDTPLSRTEPHTRQSVPVVHVQYAEASAARRAALPRPNSASDSRGLRPQSAEQHCPQNGSGKRYGIGLSAGRPAILRRDD